MPLINDACWWCFMETLWCQAQVEKTGNRIIMSVVTGNLGSGLLSCTLPCDLKAFIASVQYTSPCAVYHSRPCTLHILHMLNGLCKCSLHTADITRPLTYTAVHQLRDCDKYNCRPNTLAFTLSLAKVFFFQLISQCNKIAQGDRLLSWHVLVLEWGSWISSQEWFGVYVTFCTDTNQENVLISWLWQYEKRRVCFSFVFPKRHSHTSCSSLLQFPPYDMKLHQITPITLVFILLCLLNEFIWRTSSISLTWCHKTEGVCFFLSEWFMVTLYWKLVVPASGLPAKVLFLSQF